MATLWTLLGTLFLVLVLLRLHAAWWRRRLEARRPYDELHFAETDDGWRIALYRYRNAPTADLPPVLLCHGIGSNHRNLDLDERYSLARHLHRAGRDVWLLALRGCGASRPQSGGRLERPRGEWTFDDHLGHDVPAALARVAEATGAAEVDWVGYSMGGLLAYAHLGLAAVSDDTRPRIPRIRRLVTLGSPVSARPVDSLGLLDLVARALGVFPLLPTRPLARAFAFAAPQLAGLAAGVVSAPRAIESPVLRVAMMNAVADIPRALAQQLRQWVARARFDSADGEIDYAALLGRVTAPTLVVGGHRDKIAARGAIRHAFATLGAPRKRLLLMGREDGHQGDYGHADLSYGRHAPEEVYPAVADWLNAREPDSAAS